MRSWIISALLLLGAGYTFDTFVPVGAAQLTKPTQATPVPSANSPVQNPATNATALPVAKVDFQDAQPLTMNWQNGSMYRASFFVRNDEPDDSTLMFSAVLQDNNKDVLRPDVKLVSGKGVVTHNRFDEITIEIDVGKSEVPLSGYIQMEAKTGSDKKQPAYQYKMLKVPPQLPSRIATSLFTASLVASVVAFLVAIVWLKKKGIAFSQRMGPPAWNFSDSWGTNITVGGGLLTTLLGFGALPEQTHYLNKTAYLCLSLIFAALITVAPSIYALLRTPVNAPGATTPQYQGYVLSFALASCVTVWGALGQLGTVGLLFHELAAAREISSAVMCSLIAIVGLVAILLLLYGCRTVVQIASQQQIASRVGGAAPGVAAPPLPSWSVL
jgi:hypothetical protein